jgi:hypothetical protein
VPARGRFRARVVRVEHRLHVKRIDQEAFPCVQGGGGVGVDTVSNRAV